MMEDKTIEEILKWNKEQLEQSDYTEEGIQSLLKFVKTQLVREKEDQLAETK